MRACPVSIAPRGPALGPLVQPARRLLTPFAYTLTDNFDDNSIDASKWTSAGFYAGETTGGTVNETNQRLECTPTASAIRACGYVSASKIDLTNGAVFVKVSNAAAFSADQVAYLAFGPDSNNCYTIFAWPAGGLYCRRMVNGVATDLANPAFNATSHAWFRLRHQASDNTIHFETATSSASDPPAAGDWTDMVSEAFTSAFGVGNGSAAIGSATFAADASPGVAYLDGFNTATSAAGGSDNISGAAALTFAPSATVLGTGAVAGSAGLTIASSGAVVGLISGSSSVVLTPSATLLGGGAVTGSSALTFAPAATLLGKGAVSGSSSILFSPSATLLGAGALLASTALTFSPSATLTTLGSNAIVGSAAVTLSLSGTLLGTGSVAGSSALSLAGSGAVQGTGAVSGSVALSIAPAGTLLGAGSVAGTSVMAFAMTGEAFDSFIEPPPANRTTFAPKKPANSHADPSLRTTYAPKRAA